MNSKKDRSMAKTMFTLISGSSLGQIITILVSPIITRIYDQYEVGTLTLLLTLSTIVSPALSLRYEMAIVTERDEKKVHSIIQLAFILDALVSFFASLLIGIYCFYTGNEKGSIYFSLILFFINIITGFINIIIAYNNRRKEYKIIANGYIIKAMTLNTFMVVLGILNLGIFGIAISQILGCLFNALYQYLKTQTFFKNFEIDIVAIKSVLKEYKSQALYGTPAVLVNGISYSIINFYIDYLYGAKALGIYSISYRVLGIPISIIAVNVSKVFFEIASKEYKRNGDFFNCYKKTVFLLGLCAVLGFFIMYVFAPPLCGIFFGNGWRKAGEFIKIFSIMYSIRFIAGGVNCSAIIANRTKIDFIVQITLIIAGSGAFTVALLFRQNIVNFLKNINLLYSLIYIIYIGLYGICAKYPKRRLEIHK